MAGGSASALLVRHARTATPHKANRGHYNLSYAPGRQVLFVFIGSEDCTFSLTPGFAESVRRAERLVEKQVRAQSSAFSSLGISAGPSVEKGIEYLNRFGSFNEVAIGHGQLNSGMMKYIWEELPGEASFPQIVVVERNLVDLNPGFSFDQERVLVRVVGVPAVEKWIAVNAPIDDASAHITR